MLDFAIYDLVRSIKGDKMPSYATQLLGTKVINQSSYYVKDKNTVETISLVNGSQINSLIHWRTYLQKKHPDYERL